MKQILLFLFPLYIAASANAQEYLISKPATNAPISKNDMFGWQVSQNKDFIFVSAPFENSDKADVGGIYIYKKEGFAYKFFQHLRPSSKQEHSRFGDVFAHSDEYLVATTHYLVTTEAGKGNIHLFRFTGNEWKLVRSFKQDILPNMAAPTSIAIEGNTLVLGNPERYAKYPSGLVSVYYILPQDYSIAHSQTITIDNISTYGQIGYRVAIDKGLLAFSAIAADGRDKTTGAVWLYTKKVADWQMITKLAPPDGNAHDKFGSALAIDYPTVAVGAMRQNSTETGKKSGAVYLYRVAENRVNAEAKLTPDFAANHYDYFGCTVSLKNNVLAVGACSDDFYGLNTGATYVYRKEANSWQQVNKLIGSGTSRDAMFGSSVSVYGNDVVCSAHLDERDTSKRDHGSVFFFKNAATPGSKMLGSNYISLFPNPILDKTTIYVNDSAVRNIAVFDMGGQLVAEIPRESVQTINGSSVFTIDCRTWRDGIYMFKANTSSGIHTIKATKVNK